MKKTLFVISHLCSGSNSFCDALDTHPRVKIFRTGTIYESPLDLLQLTEQPHKLNNMAAIYGEHLVYNHEFACPSLYEISRFVYIVRPARPTLNELIGKNNMGSILNYYSYRLRRIYEMATKTPNAVLLTWQDLYDGRGLDLVEDYLVLASPLNNPTIESSESNANISTSILREAEHCYERYLYKLKQLPLRFT